MKTSLNWFYPPLQLGKRPQSPAALKSAKRKGTKMKAIFTFNSPEMAASYTELESATPRLLRGDIQAAAAAYSDESDGCQNFRASWRSLEAFEPFKWSITYSLHGTACWDVLTESAIVVHHSHTGKCMVVTCNTLAIRIGRKIYFVGSRNALKEWLPFLYRLCIEGHVRGKTLESNAPKGMNPWETRNEYLGRVYGVTQEQVKEALSWAYGSEAYEQGIYGTQTLPDEAAHRLMGRVRPKAAAASRGVETVAERKARLLSYGQ